MQLREELHCTNKGGASFLSWSINIVGLFAWDENKKCYLFFTVDPFFKWVETHAVLLLHS